MITLGRSSSQAFDACLRTRAEANVRGLIVDVLQRFEEDNGRAPHAHELPVLTAAVVGYLSSLNGRGLQ